MVFRIFKYLTKKKYFKIIQKKTLEIILSFIVYFNRKYVTTWRCPKSPLVYQICLKKYMVHFIWVKDHTNHCLYFSLHVGEREIWNNYIGRPGQRLAGQAKGACDLSTPTHRHTDNVQTDLDGEDIGAVPEYTGKISQLIQFWQSQNTQVKSPSIFNTDRFGEYWTVLMSFQMF